MSFFRKIFCCSQGSHRPDPDRDVQMRRPDDKSPVRYSKCLDCGHVIARVPPFSDTPWLVITSILSLLPLEHYEAMRKLGIVGLLPPEPWPKYPGAHTGKRPADPDAKPPKTTGSLPAFHGGPLPGLGDSPDLSDPETRAKLQAMLPQGSKSSVIEPVWAPLPGHGLAFDGRPEPAWPFNQSEEFQAHLRKIEELLLPTGKLVGGPFSLHEAPDASRVLVQGELPPVPIRTWVVLESILRPWNYRINLIGDHDGTTALTIPAGPVQQTPVSFLAVLRDAEHIGAATQLRQAEHKTRGLFKDQVYGAIAETIAMLGTCCRLKVGCVLLTKEGRVAGLGYNGAGPGMDHCHEDTCNENCRCIRTLHAEQNALYSRSGDPVVAYVTNEPCLNCTKELALAGVRRVVYLKPYTSIAEAERTARQEWIEHYKISWEALDDPSRST